MKLTSRKGFTLIEVAGAAVVLLSVFLFGKAALKAINPFGHGPSAAQVSLTAEKASAAKTGQQFAAATTQEIAKAKDQADPAIVAAKKTAARADTALDAGLGALTPAQAQWVQNLVEADAAAFNTALASKDAELVQTGNKISDLEKKVAAEQNRSDWFENLLILAAGVFVFINFVLPWLEKVFPPLAGFVTAVQLVVNPFLAKLKTTAKADIAVADDKLHSLYNQLGQAVTDMRAKLASSAAPAIAHLDGNLDQAHIDAISAAARASAATSAAAQAAAAAQVAITAP